MLENRRLFLVQLDRRRHLGSHRLDIILDLAMHPALVDEDAIVVIGEEIPDDRRGHVHVLMDLGRSVTAKRQLLLNPGPPLSQQAHVRVQRLRILALGNRTDDHAESLGHQHLRQLLQAAALLVGRNLLGYCRVVGKRNKDEEAPGQRYPGRYAAAFVRYGLLDDLHQYALVASEQVHGPPLTPLACRHHSLQRPRMVPIERLDVRLLLLHELQLQLEIFSKVRKMQKRVLLLPDVYKRGANARHQAPNATKVDVAQGAGVFGIFNVQLRKFTILNNGNTGLLSFCANDDFLSHARD